MRNVHIQITFFHLFKHLSTTGLRGLDSEGSDWDSVAIILKSEEYIVIQDEMGWDEMSLLYSWFSSSKSKWSSELEIAWISTNLDHFRDDSFILCSVLDPCEMAPEKIVEPHIIVILRTPTGSLIQRIIYIVLQDLRLMLIDLSLI